MGSTSRPGSLSQIQIAERDRTKIKGMVQARHEPVEVLSRLASVAALKPTLMFLYPAADETVSVDSGLVVRGQGMLPNGTGQVALFEDSRFNPMAWADVATADGDGNFEITIDASVFRAGGPLTYVLRVYDYVLGPGTPEWHTFYTTKGT